MINKYLHIYYACIVNNQNKIINFVTSKIKLRILKLLTLYDNVLALIFKKIYCLNLII